MTSKIKVIFDSNINQGHKTKLFTVHPIKKWVGIINQNNTFSLWNYDQKILIKSFSLSLWDDGPLITQKNPNAGQIKDIIFFDKYSLCTQGKNPSQMRNNIIFVTPCKILLYDYVTDITKHIIEKQFQQKIIKKVCVYSETQICAAMGDGSFKVIDCKDLYTKNSVTYWSVRGYHVKPITWIFSYAQNSNEMPRIITASASDGMMACWNVQMIHKNKHQSPYSDITNPCFKFMANSKLKDAGNEQLLSLQYDPSSYRLVTLSHNWIKLWSTMTGMQVKRFKNSSKSTNILFFSHFSYAPECFITYSQSSRINIIRAGSTTIQIDEIDLRSIFNSDKKFSQELIIRKIKSSPYHPAHLFIVTNYNICVLELDKFFIPPFGTSSLFLTRLSTLNSKQFITNKAEQEIRKDIKYNEIANMKFQEDILFNTFYLSVDQEWIYFNLIEIQYTTMLSESRRYKLLRLQDMSPLTNIEGGRSSIQVNFDGSQIIIFNKSLDFYQVFEAINPFSNIGSYEDLLNKTEKEQRIDFYSKFRQLGCGYCRQVIWHQYKNQFAIVGGFDDHDKMIEVKVTKQKKGFLSSKQSSSKIERSGIPTRFCVCIYRYHEGEYRLILKTENIIAKKYKLYNFGSFYGYSRFMRNGVQENVEFVTGDKNNIKEIEGALVAPEGVYVSYCQSCYILSYDRFFVVYKMQQNGSLTYMRSLEFTILHGYFWEKLFFFLTQSSLYFLHIINNETILIKIADISNFSPIETPLQIINLEDDDLEPQCKLLPPGHLQIAGLINMHIMLLNENYSNTLLISLQSFPYIIFCLQVATQTIDKCSNLLQRASPPIRKYMKQMIYNYGLVMHVPTQ